MEKCYINRHWKHSFLHLRYLQLTFSFVFLSLPLSSFLIILGFTESLEFPSSLALLSPAPYLGSAWNQSCFCPYPHLVVDRALAQTCKWAWGHWTIRTLPSSLWVSCTQFRADSYRRTVTTLVIKEEAVARQWEASRMPSAWVLAVYIGRSANCCYSSGDHFKVQV